MSRDKRQERIDSRMRNVIEGSFGVEKRKYSLNRIMGKLMSTSESSIALIILVTNLEKRLRDVFIYLLNRYALIFKWRLGINLQSV